MRDGLRHVRYILAWASGTALAVPVAVLAALGIVLVLLPGASVRDVAAGAVLLTAAALALQATVSLLVWRLIAIRGDRSGWMRTGDRPSPGARRRGRYGGAGRGGHLGLRATREQHSHHVSVRAHHTDTGTSRS